MEACHCTIVLGGQHPCTDHRWCILHWRAAKQVQTGVHSGSLPQRPPCLSTWCLVYLLSRDDMLSQAGWMLSIVIALLQTKLPYLDEFLEIFGLFNYFFAEGNPWPRDARSDLSESRSSWEGLLWPSICRLRKTASAIIFRVFLIYLPVHTLTV